MQITERSLSYLETLRAELGWKPPQTAYTPAWRVVEADDRFRWIMDGDRGVGLLDEGSDNFELRAGDPWSPAPPAVLPKHYHIATYAGLRVINKWRLRGWNVPQTARKLTWDVCEDAVRFTLNETWADGSHGTHDGWLRFDPAWGGYVAEMTADLTARKIITEQEFCNLIPPAIGDTRPGHTKYQQTIWLDRDGVLRGMGKNPLWFNSAGMQDTMGRRGIPAGGFLGWVAEPDFNPVIEILSADPRAGACTCDNLMDEHLMLDAPDVRQCPDGWFHLHVAFRLFSLPAPLAAALAARTVPPDYGPMLAWKFQYAPTSGPIGNDLNQVELPGMPPYGVADLNTPVPRDRPFFGQLWTPSSHPDADLYYDRQVGHAGHSSLRIKVEGGKKMFFPCSGPTIHTEEGRRYRVGAWIRTQGDVTAWMEGNEVLFSIWKPVETHRTPAVGPDSGWQWVETSYVARGDDAPFVGLFICAEGEGLAWYDEITFQPEE
ncbi:MAG: hypothetical protein ACYDBB_18385 [Armatimonadota bacterium]